MKKLLTIALFSLSTTSFAFSTFSPTPDVTCKTYSRGRETLNIFHLANRASLFRYVYTAVLCEGKSNKSITGFFLTFRNTPICQVVGYQGTSANCRQLFSICNDEETFTAGPVICE